MPVLQAQQLTFVLPSGEELFKPLSFTLRAQRVGVVGGNGAGKSVLAALINGELTPSGGVVNATPNRGIYRQQHAHLLKADVTIADVLGKTAVLTALQRISQGDYAQSLFDTVGDGWALEARLAEQLTALGLPADPQTCCATLSGGQLAILQLWHLFQSDHRLLILDEPSNHLDSRARHWLRGQIKTTPATVLLISHDRELLDDMQEIWALSEQGITQYGGNYTHYAEQKRAMEQAISRQLAAVQKQQAQVQEQAQRSREKAQQRASQGSRLRGSQAKCLLDSKKDRATASAASRNKNTDARQLALQQKADKLKAVQHRYPQQTFQLATGQTEHKPAIAMLNAELAFGNAAPINLQIATTAKWHLCGNNGSGKSTLFRTLLGRLPLKGGTVSVNVPLYYLDQHFMLLEPALSLLGNLLNQCRGITESDARTLLAGIGFRRDKVFRLVASLSGGEKMKLAMLIVSHQPHRPFLLLDEPDNHLDLASQQILAAALSHYSGGFMLISHDRLFASEAGCTEQYSLGQGRCQRAI